MKNRKIPYGYKIENGTIVIDDMERNVLLRIFNYYLEGLSLLNISKFLNDEKIEYMPEVCGWNKSRIMRIIEDKRYVGNESYPSIINLDMRNRMIDIKSQKNTQKNLDRTADIFQLKTPVLCPICGEEMLRKHWKKTKYKVKWCCKNDKCDKEIHITDDTLIYSLTSVLNKIIDNPQLIKNDFNDSDVNMDVMRLENEIKRTLDSNNFDKEDLRKKMVDCVGLKYQAIGSNMAITQKLKADFEMARPLKSFSPDLFNSTVKNVILNENATVSIVLINGQRIGEAM